MTADDHPKPASSGPPGPGADPSPRETEAPGAEQAPRAKKAGAKKAGAKKAAGKTKTGGGKRRAGATKATAAEQPAGAAPDAGVATSGRGAPTGPQGGPQATTADPTELAAAIAIADTLVPDRHEGPTSPEALAVWLGGRRWYADRTGPADAPDGGSAPPAAATLATVDLPVTPALAVGVATTGHGARYQLLVPGPDHPHHTDRPDVGDDPAAATELARWIARGERTDPGRAGRVVGRWLSSGTPLGGSPARPLGGEQSNTSVVIGGTHVLKLFRRLQAGPHPEIEVGRHLAEVARAGWSAPVARLAGWYELEPPDGSADGDTALGVVQDLVPGALDAWGLVLSALAGDPAALLARLHHLGTALAELHGALAEPAADGPGGDAPEAFGAVPLPPARLTEIVSAVGDDAERTLATTFDRPPELAALAGRGPEVRDLAADLAARLGTDLGAAIRHHGDLHLGQVVDSHDGWVVLDFEGEPTRPLAERRRRHSPLRDVAGMVRSFAYAAATHRRAHGHRLSDGWEPAARAAFLDGYLSAVDPALLPTSAAATRTLLSLLELEKVVYEIDYELAHRPDWVGLPVDGLARLLAQGRA